MTRTFDILDKVIGLISIIAGLFLVYNSSELFYSYNFTNILYCYMVPMRTLVTFFLFGLTSISAGFLLLKKNSLSLNLYYILAVGLLFFPFNALVDHQDSLFLVVGAGSVILALVILAYFKFRPAFDPTKTIDRKKTIIVSLIGGFAITILPTIIFFNHYYG